MVRSRVWVSGGADLRQTNQWGRPDSQEVIKQAYPPTLGASQSWIRPGLINSKLQAMTTQSNASCECSGIASHCRLSYWKSHVAQIQILWMSKFLKYFIPFKVTLARDFLPLNFRQSNLSRALSKSFKYLQFSLGFAFQNLLLYPPTKGVKRKCSKNTSLL